uniref:Uncharacterized protein n=1 Tax=Tanacetum cinerariifolium TaxID=118510 RepID=A0A699GPG9_TANCI|nr:hypothetical protein [Tanacetum cinerariifolium]
MDMNYEAIMLPCVEGLYAEEEEKVRRDLNYFSRALSFLVSLPQPRQQKRTNIPCDHYDAHDCLVEAYFSDNPMFLEPCIEERQQKRTNIPCDHYDAHDCLVEAYFSDNPMFLEPRIEERFRMSRKLFTSIVEEVIIHCAYFQEKQDRAERLCISPLLKCTFIILQLAYDTVPDALDEYLQIGQATSRLSLGHFYRSIMEIFGPEYL